MDIRYKFSLTKVFFIGLMTGLAGWVGLWFIVQMTVPTLWPRWLFYFSFTIALCGTSIPILAFLNYRFAGQQDVNPKTIIREALWVGLYGGLLLWLQLGRILNSALALFIAAGILTIEFIIRYREKSRWNVPGKTDDE